MYTIVSGLIMVGENKSNLMGIGEGLDSRPAIQVMRERYLTTDCAKIHLDPVTQFNTKYLIPKLPWLRLNIYRGEFAVISERDGDWLKDIVATFPFQIPYAELIFRLSCFEPPIGFYDRYPEYIRRNDE